MSKPDHRAALAKFYTLTPDEKNHQFENFLTLPDGSLKKVLGVIMLLSSGAIPSEDQEAKIKKFNPDTVLKILGARPFLITDNLANSKQVFGEMEMEEGFSAGNQLLILAAKNNYPDIVCNLVKNGGDFNKADDD